MEHHPWARISHHCGYTHSHRRAITMHLASAAARFPVAERASVKTSEGIGQQLAAILAQLPVTFLAMTVDPDHLPDYSFLPLDLSHILDLRFIPLRPRRLPLNESCSGVGRFHSVNKPFDRRRKWLYVLRILERQAGKIISHLLIFLNGAMRDLHRIDFKIGIHLDRIF